MNQPIDSTFIQFPTPSAAVPHAAGAQAATAAMEGSAPSLPGREARGGGGSEVGRGGPEPAEDSPGAGAKRGRPSGYSDRVVAMMKGLIRQHGFSDTAAAEGVGVSSTTISRWKKHDPELAAELLKARYDCRIYHLEIIENAAAADNGRGWRASAWMLERLFPGDYSPKMAERFAYMNLEDKLRYREESDLVYDDVRLRLAKEKAQRAQAAAAAEQRASASEGGSRNSRNSDEPVPAEPMEEAVGYSAVGECQFKEPGRPRPVDPNREAALSETDNVHGADEHTDESGASRNGSMGRGRPGSLEAAVPADASCSHSEGGSRNSRNSAEPEPGTRAPGARLGENGHCGPDGPACLGAPAAQNCAILPETPGGAARMAQPAGSRLSRRERRAEERRNARAQRVHA